MSAARPPLYFAERLTAHFGGAKIYLKREDLNHTGAHKVNNVLGQIMLAKRMGKPRVIAETGAGMHGVATATLCAKFGLECVVHMGAVDIDRQQPNVMRMKALGAEVRPVMSGSRTLKDAMNEALRDWVTNVANTFYCIGTVAGPHPYPAMVRDFQCVIGNETRAQMQEAEGRLPDSLLACIGGGSNAMGLFHPFLDDRSVEIYGVEAAGHGLDKLHAASIAGGRPGVLHGNRTYLLMDADGQIQEAHSISAGLDYPGHRPGACLARRHGPREIPLGDRQGGGRGVPALLAPRRHHPGARIRACARAPRRSRAGQAEGSPDRGQSLGPRRQGPRQRRALSRGQFVKFLDHRQKRTGWLLIVDVGGYLVWFLKVRLLTAGLPIEKKEWIYFAGMIVILMLGTANIRLAAMREQRKLDQSDKTSA